MWLRSSLPIWEGAIFVGEMACRTVTYRPLCDLVTFQSTLEFLVTHDGGIYHWHLWCRGCVSVCACVCPRSKSKTAWAIDIKYYTDNILYDRTSTCIDLTVWRHKDDNRSCGLRDISKNVTVVPRHYGTLHRLVLPPYESVEYRVNPRNGVLNGVQTFPYR